MKFSLTTRAVSMNLQTLILFDRRPEQSKEAPLESGHFWGIEVFLVFPVLVRIGFVYSRRLTHGSERLGWRFAFFEGLSKMGASLPFSFLNASYRWDGFMPHCLRKLVYPD